MTRIVRHITVALGTVLLVAPVLLSAQRAPGAGVERPGPVSRLLDARRQLDLSPRQIIQLDSLERIQYAERMQFNERMRGARDSMMTRARSGARAPGARSPGARDSLQVQARARMEAERPQLEQRRRRDSSLSAAAERVLNDSQRQKMREMSAERRGYERGMRESRAPRGGRSRDGMRGGQPRDGMRGDQPRPGMRGGRAGEPMDRPRGSDAPRGRPRPGPPTERPDGR